MFTPRRFIRTFTHLHMNSGRGKVCIPSRRFHSRHNGSDDDTPWHSSKLVKRKQTIEFLNSGSIILDLLLGGGFPKSELTLLSGQDHHVKNLLAMNLILHTQRKSSNAVCAIVDCSPAPFSFPFGFCNKINKDQLLVSKVDDPIKAFQIANELCKSNLQVVVVDIMSSSIPREYFSRNLLDIKNSLSDSNCVLLYLHPYNTIRNDNSISFFNEEILRDEAALHLEVEYLDDIRESDKNNHNNNKINNKINNIHTSQIIGNRFTVKVLQNLHSTLPEKAVTLDMLFSKGITKELELKNLASLFNMKPTTNQSELIRSFKDYLFK